MSTPRLVRTIELSIACPNSPALQSAIAYLSTWHNYPIARISFDSDGYGEAHYYDGSTHKYTIGAVLDSTTNTYSFHS